VSDPAGGFQKYKISFRPTISAASLGVFCDSFDKALFFGERVHPIEKPVRGFVPFHQQDGVVRFDIKIKMGTASPPPFLKEKRGKGLEAFL